MPTYNRSISLEVAVTSVIKQSNPNWNLLIIDDGSTDGTRELLEPFLSDKRISYHFQENAGVSSARNLGIQLAKSNYILFLDSDDYFLPGLFENLFSENLQKYDLICWLAYKENNGERKLWKPKRLEAIYNHKTATFLAGTACYKKNLLLKHGGFDTRLKFGENYELGLRLCQEELEIKIIEEPYLIIDSKSRNSDSITQRLHSCIYQYHKHNDLYQKDLSSKSVLLYMIAYLLENLNKFSFAKKLYHQSWVSNPLNYKAFLKFLFLNIKRA